MTRVLCVDDDRPILDGLHAFPWNVYHCEWAGEADNGEKALTMLDSLQPDLIVLDIQMPCMDGLSFIPRAQQTLPKAKYIVLSAYRNFDYARIAMRYGVSEYLTKGEFTDEDLGNAIGRLFPQEEKAPLRFEIERCLQLMETQLSDDISLASIAVQIGISPNYLGNLFYQHTGQHFRDYLTKLRMERARELLLHTPLRIYEVAQQVGIQNPQYFSMLFQKAYGKSPGQLRK